MIARPTTRHWPRLAASLALVALLCVSTVSAQPSYWLFESGPTRPLALSSDGARLYLLNTPDAHLEIYDVSTNAPVHLASVPVGLEPVAVALRDDTEAWVVNHLSDSVSVVDLAASPPHVVRTLQVGDAPEDVVFAGAQRDRAFVTAARRGQNTADPRGAYDTPGVGRADVYVFDANAPGDDLLPQPITVLTLFADRARSLAISPDGASVYAAAFLSGNRTTVIPADALCGQTTSGSCVVAGGTSPGPLPPPRRNAAGAIGPKTGLIVAFDEPSGQWRDELGRDFSTFVRFSLPDEDVFRIDAMAATPSVVESYAHVGTVLFGMAVHPTDGRLYVANTEARNRVRFEGLGTYVRQTQAKPPGEPASVRGHLHEARVTVIDGLTATPRRLNTHLDHSLVRQPADARGRSLATPVALALSADGATLYVSAFGSSAVGVVPTAALEAGGFVPDATSRIELSAGGPSGLVLDEARDRAFVATRFDGGVSVVSLSQRAELAHARPHDPEPAEVIHGRPFLYDARLSSTGEASCASCHVFGDLDGLAWDLGNPDEAVRPNPNPIGLVAARQAFSPLKGPMTTQTLRGMSTHGPLHWRGDRTAGDLAGGDPMDAHAGFTTFAGAFHDLLGRDEGPLEATRMARFADFAMRLTMPPNPIRNLDGSLRVDEARGRAIYFDAPNVDQVTTCNGCHVLDPAVGFFGSDGRTTFENEPQEFKIAHMRNAYEKVGMFGMAESNFLTLGDNQPMGPQIRGFGFLHDGSIDTVARFLRATVFTGLTSETQRRDLEAFIMAFDSDLAPVVGQQVTVDEGATTAELVRARLLDTAAGTPFVLMGAPDARRCDLVVHGVVDGEARSYLRRADGSFDAARTAQGFASLDALLAVAAAPDNRVTFTCAPPGAGVRMALDRDEDGMRDLDERDLGRSPSDRPFPEPPVDPVETPDAGTPSPDAGGGGMRGGGCDCSVGVARRGVPARGGLAVTALAFATGLARAGRRRRRVAPPRGPFAPTR